MQGRKSIATIVVIYLVIALMYSLVAFAVPFIRTPSFFVSYIWGDVAILASLLETVYMYDRSPNGKSALYRVSLATIAVAYLVVALVFAIICMAVLVPVWLVVIVQVVLLAVSIIGFIGGEATAELVENDEVTTAAATSTMNTLRIQAQSALALAGNEQTRQALKDLCEKLRFSDPVSTSQTAPVEAQLSNLMVQIHGNAPSADGTVTCQLISQMATLLDQRNSIAKMSK
jgi:hypothetical protein